MGAWEMTDTGLVMNPNFIKVTISTNLNNCLTVRGLPSLIQPSFGIWRSTMEDLCVFNDNAVYKMKKKDQLIYIFTIMSSLHIQFPVTCPIQLSEWMAKGLYILCLQGLQNSRNIFKPRHFSRELRGVNIKLIQLSLIWIRTGFDHF